MNSANWESSFQLSFKVLVTQSYLQLLNSSFEFFKNLNFNSFSIYYSAALIFVGRIIIIIPPETFASIPSVIRPISSNGLLVDTILALVLENLFNWDTIKE